jgi:hypothetical protein
MTSRLSAKECYRSTFLAKVATMVCFVHRLSWQSMSDMLRQVPTLCVHTMQEAFAIVWEKVPGILQQILTGVKAASRAFKHKEIDDSWMLAAGRNMASLAPSSINSCLTMWDAFQSDHTVQDSVPILELSIMFTIAWAARGANASLLLECADEQLERLIADAFRAASMQQIPSEGQLWDCYIHPSSCSWTTWSHIMRTRPPVPADADAVSHSKTLSLYILQPEHLCLQHIVGAVTESGGNTLVEAASQPAIDMAWHAINAHKLPILQNNMTQWVSTGCSSSMQIGHIRVCPLCSTVRLGPLKEEHYLRHTADLSLTCFWPSSVHYRGTSSYLYHDHDLD